MHRTCWALVNQAVNLPRLLAWLLVVLLQLGGAGGALPLQPGAPPPLPRCASRRCPQDFNNSGIAGRFPSGASPCAAATTCVRDVFPGCSDYRGDSAAPWGSWCADTIAAFDQNRSLPQNISTDAHPIYYFKPAKKAKAYIIYLPPSGNLPINQDQGRYEYFLLQWSKQPRAALLLLPGDGW